MSDIFFDTIIASMSPWHSSLNFMCDLFQIQHKIFSTLNLCLSFSVLHILRILTSAQEQGLKRYGMISGLTGYKYWLIFQASCRNKCHFYLKIDCIIWYWWWMSVGWSCICGCPWQPSWIYWLFCKFGILRKMTDFPFIQNLTGFFRKGHNKPAGSRDRIYLPTPLSHTKEKYAK